MNVDDKIKSVLSKYHGKKPSRFDWVLIISDFYLFTLFKQIYKAWILSLTVVFMVIVGFYQNESLFVYAAILLFFSANIQPTIWFYRLFAKHLNADENQ